MKQTETTQHAEREAGRKEKNPEDRNVIDEPMKDLKVETRQNGGPARSRTQQGMAMNNETTKPNSKCRQGRGDRKDREKEREPKNKYYREDEDWK